MSVEPIHLPAPSGGFVHHLLRARDWQDRPEFEELCQWWKSGGVGVCALVGIGGAGKTAIAERFLQVLPGGYPEHPKVPKDRSLPAPARLLVFSFYDAPNPDTFFNTLAAWLEGRSPDETARLSSYHQTLDLLAKAGKCLLVLDGLEKVQDDGARGGVFGRILDGRLRDFVLSAADGWLPQVSLLITSRFRLFDPLASRASYYRQIEIERLRPSAAVQLLRDRGVLGTDEQLEHIAREQGFHALSVDLAGGYIAYFCAGDPQHFSSFSIETESFAGRALDPRIASIREQERKFALLAEQYTQALDKSDPGALALLQRICLFRLGIEAKILSAIFIGEGKERISGPVLVALNEQELQDKLRFLVELRLVEASKSQIPNQKSLTYTVHPAVRDGFLAGLDEEVTRLGHDAARQGLEASLGGQSGGYPSDPGTLDLLEEIVHHSLAAGYAEMAWGVYTDRIGSFENLGFKLGLYERGERIIREFAGGGSPGNPVVPDDFDREQLLMDWAIYFSELGRFVEVIECCDRIIEGKGRLSVGAKMLLAWALMRTGEIFRCIQECKDFITLESFDSDKKDGDARRAIGNLLLSRALLLRGEVGTGLREAETYLKLAEPLVVEDEPVAPAFLGVWYCTSLLLMGRKLLVKKLVMEEIRPHLSNSIEWASYIPHFNLILAEIATESDDLTAAYGLLHEAHEWAIQHNAKEPLCWSALVRGKIALSALGNPRSASAETSLASIALVLEEGLRIARDCGYGLYHIDLLLVRAQLALHEGRAADAERDIQVALDEGVHPPPDSGYPELLAANDPECLYAWGIVEGRHLRGEALLLQAAQKLGHADFAPGRLDRLPAEVRELIGRAREELDQAMELWRKLRDPESEAEINPHGEKTRQALERLEGGVLTEYPLEPVRPEIPAVSQETPGSGPGTGETRSAPRVLISYSQDSPAHGKRVLEFSNRLRGDGVDCWVDQYETNPSVGWPLWMHQQVESADFVLVVFTERYAQKSLEEKKSGVRFESVLILQDLYEAGMLNDKFIPVLFDRADEKYVVKWLRPYNVYRVDDNPGYETLRRRLLNDPAVVPPPLGAPARKGPAKL